MIARPLVSIIVPIYNVEIFLDRCIKSLLDQTYTNIEIILINDGSPDNCGEIIDAYKKKDSRIRVIHKRNGGLSDARNAGLDFMMGEYVTFVDSDDFIHRDMVSKLLNTCLDFNCEISQCQYIKGSQNSFNNLNVDTIKKIKTLSNKDALLSNDLKTVAWAKIYESTLFDNIRYPKEKINEDEFITYKLIYGSKTIGIIREKLYYYYQSENSIMSNLNKKIKFDFMEAFEERLLFFENRSEKVLWEKSVEKFCFSLVNKYANSLSSASSVNDSAMLLEKFNELFPYLMNSRYISMKKKIFFKSFNMMPKHIGNIFKTLKEIK